MHKSILAFTKWKVDFCSNEIGKMAHLYILVPSMLSHCCRAMSLALVQQPMAHIASLISVFEVVYHAHVYRLKLSAI